MSKKAPGGQTGRITKPAGSDTSKKKSLKDGAHRGSLEQIKEGDIFYKVSRIYPSVQETVADEDVTLSVTRLADLAKESPVQAPSAPPNTRKSADSRRGSVYHQMSRDDIGTPLIEDRSVAKIH